MFKSQLEKNIRSTIAQLRRYGKVNMRRYQYQVKMYGFEPVSGTVEASNATHAKLQALAAFEIANDIPFEPEEGITLADRIKFYSPKITKI
jgi:hypothetical protein